MEGMRSHEKEDGEEERMLHDTRRVETVWDCACDGCSGFSKGGRAVVVEELPAVGCRGSQGW